MRIFKDLEFADWAEDEGLTDEGLKAAAREIENGLVDARLGGSLVKKRVAAPGRGKRGGYRTLVAHRLGDRLVFLYGFAKNERDNITRVEQAALKKLGAYYMDLPIAALASALPEVL